MSEFIDYNFMYAMPMCIYKHSLLSLCTKTFICCKMFHIHLNNVLHSMHSPCKYSKLKFNVWTMCKTLPRFRNLKYVNFKMNNKTINKYPTIDLIVWLLIFTSTELNSLIKNFWLVEDEQESGLPTSKL